MNAAAALMFRAPPALFLEQKSGDNLSENRCIRFAAFIWFAPLLAALNFSDIAVVGTGLKE
jgi:hypothetical protein